MKDTADGNFIDFDIREADLANHLEQPLPVKADKDAKAEVVPVKNTEKPTAETKNKKKAEPKFYKYGEADDYQLQQAVAFLKKHAAERSETAGVKTDASAMIREKVEPIR